MAKECDRRPTLRSRTRSRSKNVSFRWSWILFARSFGYADLAPDERRLRTALTALRSGLVDSSE
jgi:hypothetical protein